MFDASTWFLIVFAAFAIVVLLTMRGVILQGTRLDRFLDGVGNDVAGYVDGAVDSARDEIAEMRNELENLRDAYLNTTQIPTDPIPDTESVKHLNAQIDDIRRTLIEEKNIRDRQTQSLGANLEIVVSEVNKKLDVRTLNKIAGTSAPEDVVEDKLVKKADVAEAEVVKEDA